MSPPHPRPILIACAADDRYVQPLAVMLQSVVANLAPGRQIAAVVIDGGIEPVHHTMLAKSWDPKRIQVRFVVPREECLAGLPLWGRMPIATYYKLLVPDILPPDATRAIWLDCDLVVTCDIAQLWDTELAGRHALAVRDHSIPTVSSPNGVAPWRRLGLQPDAGYFNAGVMLMSPDLWRRDDVKTRAIEYLREHHDTVVFWDQEALNAVLSGRWGELNPRWNCIANPRGARAAAADPWVYHFTGNLKPWLYPDGAPSHALYYRYLDQTAWAGWRPDPSLVRTLLGRYQSSALRRMLYPIEEGFMRLTRAFTRRDACAPSSR